MIVSGFREKWSKTLFFVGLFQLFLAYILVGWIFSIYWGVLIVRKSMEGSGSEDQQNLFGKQFARSDAPKGNDSD